MTRRLTDEELAREAQAWKDGTRHPKDWQDASDAVPRSAESVSISIRMPSNLLLILKEFARREGLGYQVLLKRWLDDRIRHERERLRDKEGRVIRLDSPKIIRAAASFVGSKELADEAGVEELGRLARELRSRGDSES
jgi:predicted DNA binding CopG/RHH family protein